MTGEELKPVVKWAGGKSQLLPQIACRLPSGLGRRVTRYCEPMAGGAALLFHLLGRVSFEAVYLSDINAELMNMYRAVRDDVTGLCGLLRAMEKEYLALDEEGRGAWYAALRDRYNDRVASGESRKGTESAALFLALNRTCYNGLYRVNAQGRFNVPHGRFAKPVLCQEARLRAVSRALASVELVCGDYRLSRSFIDGRTLVYLDPPYQPPPGGRGFTAYAGGGFSEKDHEELAAFVRELCAAGAWVLVSSSDPSRLAPGDGTIRRLYPRLIVNRLEAVRPISASPAGRGRITELLIRNF